MFNIVITEHTRKLMQESNPIGDEKEHLVKPQQSRDKPEEGLRGEPKRASTRDLQKINNAPIAAHINNTPKKGKPRELAFQDVGIVSSLGRGLLHDYSEDIHV